MSVDTNSDNYAQVPLAKISADKELPSDIFVKINDKFIKFKSAKDHITKEKFNLFLAKHVKFLFITKENLAKFIEWIEADRKEIAQTLINKVGEDAKEIVEDNLEIEENVINVFAAESLEKQQITDLENQTANFIDKTRKFKTSKQILANLTKFNLSIASHSVNVANLSVFLAMALGQQHQYLLENIYLASLFHDYAKAKIDPKILQNVSGSNYSHAINIHPTEAVRIMKQVKKMPGPVFTIVEQHEEQYNGAGYPKGLKGDQIYSLTQILSFCNVFENLVSKNKSKDSQSRPPTSAYETTLKAMKLYAGTKFEEQFTNQAILIFSKTLGINIT